MDVSLNFGSFFNRYLPLRFYRGLLIWSFGCNWWMTTERGSFWFFFDLLMFCLLFFGECYNQLSSIMIAIFS